MPGDGWNLRRMGGGEGGKFVNAVELAICYRPEWHVTYITHGMRSSRGDMRGRRVEKERVCSLMQWSLGFALPLVIYHVCPLRYAWEKGGK